MFDIRRRKFITLIGSAAAWPLAGHAQQVAKLWRIGYLAESRRQVDEIFRQSLRKLGYIEGSNVTMIYRWAAGGSFDPLADDLMTQNVDLIVAVASPATRAVKARTTRIPIVIVDVGDPVALRLKPCPPGREYHRHVDASVGDRRQGDTVYEGNPPNGDQTGSPPGGSVSSCC